MRLEMYPEILTVQFDNENISLIGEYWERRKHEIEFTGEIGSFSEFLLSIPASVLEQVSGAILPYAKKYYNEPKNINYNLPIFECYEILRNLKQNLLTEQQYKILIELPFSIAIQRYDLFDINSQNSEIEHECFFFKNKQGDITNFSKKREIQCLLQDYRVDEVSELLSFWKEYLNDQKSVIKANANLTQKRYLSKWMYKGSVIHSMEILRTVADIMKIQNTLPEFLKRREKELCLKPQRDRWLELAFGQTLQNKRVIFFQGIVAMEQYELLDKKLYYKKCKLCGKPFITTKSNSNYCKRKNEQYDGKLCYRIGPAITFADKDYYHDYCRVKAGIQKWCNENREFARKNASSEEYQIIDADLVSFEMTQMKELEKAKESLINHFISFDVFLDRINVSRNIRIRSEALYQLRQRMKEY